jgi:hypothetical protein
VSKQQDVGHAAARAGWPVLGLLTNFPLSRGARTGRAHPVITLEADPGDPDKLWMVWNFGDAAQPRRLMRWQDLGCPTKPRLPVVIKLDIAGKPYLVIQKKSFFPVWARERLAGTFSFCAKDWRVALLVLAAVGHDTRGLEEYGAVHGDGDPLNVQLDNLALPTGGMALPRVLDDLSDLAYVSECRVLYSGNTDRLSWPAIASGVPDMERLVRHLKTRYATLRVRTRLLEAARDDEHRDAYYEARVTIEGKRPDGTPDIYAATGGGSFPDEAVFHATFEAMRRMVFYGHAVPYCGVQVRRGRLRAELHPIDLYGGRYKLVVVIEGEPDRWQDPPPLTAGLLTKNRYEMVVELEARGGDQRTDYFNIVGGIDKEIREGFAAMLNFGAYPVRLHRLAVALGWTSLINPEVSLYRWRNTMPSAEELAPSTRSLNELRALGGGQGVRQFPSSLSIHLHHRHAIGNDNRAAGLEAMTSERHAKRHFNWSEIMKKVPLEPVRAVSRWGDLPVIRVGGEGWAVNYARTLHTTVRRALELLNSPQRSSPTPMPQALELHRRIRDIATAKGCTKPDTGTYKRVSMIVRELWTAGGTATVDEMISLTSIPKGSLYRWLKGLSEAEIIVWDKGTKKQQGSIKLKAIEYLNVSPPFPRVRTKGEHR